MRIQRPIEEYEFLKSKNGEIQNGSGYGSDVQSRVYVCRYGPNLQFAKCEKIKWNCEFCVSRARFDLSDLYEISFPIWRHFYSYDVLRVEYPTKRIFFLKFAHIMFYTSFMLFLYEMHVLLCVRISVVIHISVVIKKLININYHMHHRN